MSTTEGMWKDLKDICVWPWKMVGLWWLQRLASDGSNRSHGLSEPQQWIWNGQEFQGSCNEDQKRHLDLTTETQGVCVIACVWADWRCSGRPIWSALFLRKTICQKHKGGMETQKARQPGREFKKPLIIFFFIVLKTLRIKLNVHTIVGKAGQIVCQGLGNLHWCMNPYHAVCKKFWTSYLTSLC